MKHLLLTLTLTLLTLTVAAQTDHLKFNGIPIDGTLQTFSSALCQKGFTYVGAEDGVASFQGMVTGHKATVAVIVNAAGQVYRVGIVYDGMEQWQFIENLYEGLKEMLTTKYGEPTEITETIPPYCNDDKMFACKMDLMTWETSFTAPQGTIQLKVVSLFPNQGNVVLIYEDETNGNATYDSYLDEL